MDTLILKNEIVKTIIHNLDSSGSVKFDNNSTYIKLTHLIFKTKNEITTTEFKNKIKNDRINIKLGGVSEYIDLSLCCELDQPIKLENNTITIKIPFDYTFEYIIIGKLCTQHCLIFYVELDDKLYFEQISVVVEHRNIINHDELVRIQNLNIEKCIQQFQTCEIKPDQNKMEITERLYFNFPTKGYFIECDNINNISNVKFNIYDTERFNYDKIMLDLFAFKISKSLMFISFTNKNNYKECTVESYIGSLNQSMINNMSMTIKFDTQMSSLIKIHSININIQRYMYYMIGNVFAD